MIRADNCIYFGEELSRIYDSTRPFRSMNSTSPVLQELCGRLINANLGQDRIRLLDVGAGTGRVTLPLAKHYEKLAETIKDAPKLEIVCVEKSTHMLSRLKEKNAVEFEYVSIDTETTRDIRDYLEKDVAAFDAVVAHWVFHVVSDWTVAVYAIDRALKASAQVFLLSEQSDLYRAIDGDYRDIGDATVRDLWQEYHRERSKIALKLSAGAPVLPPRFRLGSMVIDDRVEQMFQALGWNTLQDFEKSETWTSSLSLKFIIDTVIRQRAFTNMRLLPQEAKAKQHYEELADSLQKRLTAGELAFNWRIDSHFSARLLSRSPEETSRQTTRELMLHVLRDTLGRRWKRRKEHAYNRNTLWRRLFATTWHRLNTAAGVTAPFIVLGSNISDLILSVYTNAPFAENTDTERHCSVTAHSCDCIDDGYIDTVWGNVTGAIETHDPFRVVFLNRKNQYITEGALPPDKATDNPDQIIHPHIHSVEVTAEEEKLLLDVPDPRSCTEEKGRAWDALVSHRTGILRKLVERARQVGVVPFHNRDAQTRFLLGLAQIAQCREAGTVYFFPFRADFQDPATKTLGMCLFSKATLPIQICDFLWTINDLIFNEYLEDILADMELHLHDEVANSIGPAVAKIKPRVPVMADKWASATAPAILVIVATKLELNTLIELAGMKDTLKARRKFVGSCWSHELGFEDMPVWAVCTARAGSGTPGGSLSTVISSLSAMPEKPYAVIMPGIAYGLQRRKQRLGDVLVSDRVCVYEMQKLNPGSLKINRDVKPSATPELIRLLQSCEMDWSLGTPEKDRPTVDYGLIMSGEKLVNDPEFVAELLDREPEALGGEMEAAGLYAGAIEFSSRWIMIKAICDWGMGKGDKYQKIAARNSIDFLYHVLQQPSFADAIRAEKPHFFK